MAVAKAECTCKTCGHTFEVRTYKANRREADSFEAWAAENIIECNDCAKARKEAQHAEENAKAAQIANENEYPELQGTEKQIAWANTIREKAMATIEEYYNNSKRDGEMYQYQKQAVISVTLSRVNASWWIDHRGSVEDFRSIMFYLLEGKREIFDHINEVCKSILDGETTLAEAMAEFGTKEEPKEEKSVRPEAVPENRKHNGSVDIKVEEGKVVAIYDRDDTFRAVVKEMEFFWQDAWIRPISEATGTAENVAAELGSRLLAKGFAVRFDTQDLMDRAVNGDYIPMHHRWILNRPEGFFITWGSDDGHYHQAISIPGAKYQRPGVLVPERSWDAIVDFSRKYDYRIGTKAQEKLNKLSGASEEVSPAEVRKPVYNETSVLDSSREVIEDLRDD